MNPLFKSLLLLVVLSAIATTQAFVTPSPAVVAQSSLSSGRLSFSTSTALNERRWNFNDGQSPWGMKNNAEIWNGRFAQMAFVVVFLQELIQGHGIVEGLEKGDPVNLAGVGVFAVSLVGLTAWLALQGDDDYVTRDLERISRGE